MHIREFGNPNTELCQELRMFVQLKTAFILQTKIDSGFLSNVSFSIVCKKEARKPMAEATVRVVNNILCLVGCCFMIDIFNPI